MKRINVTFYDETVEILKERVEKNGSRSVAHEIREIVDLYLQIEKLREKNGENSIDDTLKKLIDMTKKDLIWSFETRLLARHLIEHLPGEGQQNSSEILSICKEKANSYVEGMLDEAVK